MTVNLKINSTPFVDIDAMDEGQRLFEVQLTLTSEGDPELCQVTNCINKDIGDETG